MKTKGMRQVIAGLGYMVLCGILSGYFGAEGKQLLKETFLVTGGIGFLLFLVWAIIVSAKKEG